MANLGFVGLGVMGGQLVNRLLDKGHTVTGYNRTRSKAQWLVKRGMKVADSPGAVCRAADVTFSMVTNSAALGEIADGPSGMLAGLGAGKVLVDAAYLIEGHVFGYALDFIDGPPELTASGGRDRTRVPS